MIGIQDNYKGHFYYKSELKIHDRILKVFSILMMIGGLVRLIAGSSAFDTMGMNALWTDHDYFIYIYRVLGAFVVFAGLVIYVAATNVQKYRPLLTLVKWAFVFIGIVMLISGITTGLPLVFYVFDFVFCFAFSGYLFFKQMVSNR